MAVMGRVWQGNIAYLMATEKRGKEEGTKSHSALQGHACNLDSH
jgi:hypothetical protein